ncbi:MAG TPA: MBL fold metallo-hydrolase [Dehalococcoidia bacterium]
MATTVTEIGPDVFRISTFPVGGRLAFGQFLIRDERPLLFHTGGRRIFDDTLAAISSLIEPATLRYIGWSHLESDECGAMNDFLRVAPDAEPVHSPMGKRLGADDFFDRPVLAVDDGEVLNLGSKRLRFLTTPHVPHSWEAIMAFEETTGTLFASDLFTTIGETPALTDHDIVAPALQMLEQAPDYLPAGPRTAGVFERLCALQPKVIAGHHAPAYTGDTVQALRDLCDEMLARVGLQA